MAARTQLAVLGSPIAHSKSPALHRAAYAALGLDWSYDAIELTGDALPAFADRLDDSWRGLSLTMPLKRDVLPLLASTDAVAALTEAANTVLVADDGLHGFNTDVFGIAEAFRANGIDQLDYVQVLGGGATAASALVAVSHLGASRVVFQVRDPARGSRLSELGAKLGVNVAVRPFLMQDRSMIVPSAIISTLPGHSPHDLNFAEPIRAGAVLFDVAYDPWPSVFATAWNEVGGTVISGLDMLTLQALAQVRVFANGSPDLALVNEASILAAMKAAVAL